MALRRGRDLISRVEWLLFWFIKGLDLAGDRRFEAAFYHSLIGEAIAGCY
jgi:hypothetical protein